MMLDRQLAWQRLAQQLHDPIPQLFDTDFCPQCQDMLSVFVSDELADNAVDSLYQAVANHLYFCLHCQIEYEALSVMTTNALYDEGV